ncbi:MAG: dihydroorotase [Proteobacteria bacterium]|nr:dihydroorotase [Pseudomonadota bacterium]
MDKLVITRPDDWHLHLRDDAMLASVLPYTCERFSRAVVMPNLSPPITTVAQAAEYRQRILQARPADSSFSPLMTLYLTDNTTDEEIRKVAAAEFVVAVKYYPAGATTLSDAGVTAIEKVYRTLDCMQANDVPLLVHGEATDLSVDVFDREKAFIDQTLAPLAGRYPQLRMVFEHISTTDAVDFVLAARQGIAATITPQHLLLNRNALFAKGLQPHHYCLPVLKSERHRLRVLEAATSGSERFFLGTDSAPHATEDKQSACGCAGIFSAHAAIELYAEAFDQAGRLDRLEAFASHYGADFYQLPRNEETVTLTKSSWTVSRTLEFGKQDLTPLRAGSEVAWRLEHNND